MKFLKKIDKTDIMEKVTRAASKCGYKLKKASPTIMIVGAAIGGVTATVLACKATIKAQDIMTEHYAQVESIHTAKKQIEDGTVQLSEGDTYYQGGSGNRQGNPNRAVGRSLQNLDFEFRGDADDTLSQMYDAIRQYGQVSVGDLWDLMGVSNESTDYNYGWYNLDGAFIKGIPGGYRLMLPRPVPLR